MKRLWQHDETGRTCWSENPGPRWYPVPIVDDPVAGELAKFVEQMVEDGIQYSQTKDSDTLDSERRSFKLQTKS